MHSTLGVAELDEAGALGVHRDRALEGDAAKFVGLTLGGAHAGNPIVDRNGCGRCSGDCIGSRLHSSATEMTRCCGLVPALSAQGLCGRAIDFGA